MSGGKFAPKIRALTANETSSSFEIWKENLIFNLTIDGSYEEFLEDNFTWGPTTENHRGLVADEESVHNKRTAKQKAAMLQLMLGSIASYSPVISRQAIVRDALCLNDIWSRLRTYYGFRKTGALILDLTTLCLETGESYENLWERYHAFITDNLLSPTDNINHLGAQPATETLTPTLLNTAIVLWLKAIHPGLPSLVKQKFATALRNSTIASIREEISESLESLVSEVSGESANAIIQRYYQKPSKSFKPSQRSNKFCPLCEANKRPSSHYLSECMFLPESDKKYLQGRRSKTRCLDAEEDDDDDEYSEQLRNSPVRATSVSNSKTRKVSVKKSPVMNAFFNNQTVPLTLDTGAEADVMKRSYAESLGVKIYPTSGSASQADGESDLDIVGEVHCKFTRGKHNFTFHGLVAENLSDNVLCGVPFQADNDVYARPSTKTIYIGNDEVPYDDEVIRGKATQRGCKAVIMRLPRQAVLLPEESLQLPVPPELCEETIISIEPRMSAPSISHSKYTSHWLKPHLTTVHDGILEVTNSSSDPILIRRHEQIAVVRPVKDHDQNIQAMPISAPNLPAKIPTENSDYKSVSVDPDKQLTDDERMQFHNLHLKYKDVFDSRTLGCYNGASGPLEVCINMGPTLPPQRKGKMPLYSRSMEEEQQRICDELEGTVLVKPEDVNINVEYLNPSFLIKKPSGKKRLVTAFGEVGQYAKPQPALMPDTNQVLRVVSNWSVILKTDLSSAYWQMILQKASMKYCGIVTPFRGIRVYARGAMGMPGTETALEELMCRILGDLLLKGNVAKIADDLYVGGGSPREVLDTWSEVLAALQKNGLRLSAGKTECCPKSTIILGWLWSQGTIKATPHKLSALANAEVPVTVKQLRSYLGSYKSMSRVMKSYVDVLSPLEDMVAGKKSSEKLKWNESLINAFKISQKRAPDAETLTLPKKGDHLQIITDASQSKHGLAAALYVIRHNSSYVAGYYNAKYKPHQRDWIPCELEALAIGSAVTHFSQDIVNSQHQTCVLTDSLPCVQAYQRLCKGRFSASARVSTFLSTVCRFNVKLLHIKGSMNQYSDYASRNPPECKLLACQICKFVHDIANSVVRACTVTDVLNSETPVPYSSRSGWYELQSSCESLRRTCAHLKQGTTPSKKSTKIRDVKRYLQVAKVARDGLVVVEHHQPSAPKSEKIVVPRQYLHGLLECLHIKLQHPSKAQLRKIFTRAFYALDFEEALDSITSSCHTCVSLSNMPNKFLHQTSTSHPDTVGSMLAADVLRRSCQFILIVREYVTSFTHARFINDEKAQTLRAGIIIACSEMFSRHGPQSTVRVDPASCFRSLAGDKTLKASNITLELGREKYINKNPVAEHAVRELHAEINRVSGDNAQITDELLAMAVANLNSRIRAGGLSSIECYTQRDQFSGEQIPLDDRKIIQQKEEARAKSHQPSSVYKSRGKTTSSFPAVKPGDLVYINSDRIKTKPRDRYLVVSVEKTMCSVQKFSGSQLRARAYTVNRADIITIKPWKFPDVAEEAITDDEVQSVTPVKDYTEPEHVEHNTSSEHDESSEDEAEYLTEDDLQAVVPVDLQNEDVQVNVPVQEAVQPNQNNEAVLGKRRRRKPAYLAAYECESD